MRVSGNRLLASKLRKGDVDHGAKLMESTLIMKNRRHAKL